MATPASADPNRFHRPLASHATRDGEAAGNVQDVRERLKKVEQLQASGKTVEAVAELLSIAEAYATRGAPVKAVAVLRQAAKIRPDAADIRVALGDVQQQLRMVEDAAREYATAFEIYERSRQFGDMMQVLGRLLEMDPDNLAGQLQLAEHLARAGHNHEAAGLMRTLAATLLRKGSVEDWEKVAERAHGLAPNDVTLAHDLALHYVHSGRPSLALGKLLKCYESVPNDAELLELIIESLEQLGQREKAAVICRQLIRTFERNGLKDEANRALERLYWLAPDDDRARAHIGVMAPSVQGGTVIELQAGPNGNTATETVASGADTGVTVARSRPGTMALPQADLERLQAAIARQAEEKATALLDDAPPLPDDEPPPVPTAPLVRETAPESSAVSAKPVPAIVHAPTAAQSVASSQVAKPAAAAQPAAAKSAVPPAMPETRPAQKPTPAASAAPAPTQPAATTPMAARIPDLTPHPGDFGPARTVSQSRVTHQQALEALSELDDLETSGSDWDDEAGFETAEPTLVEHISVEVLERHGLRLAEKPAPELMMPVTSRAQHASAAEPEATFNPVASAQPRSQILPRPRLSRQAGVGGEVAQAPRDMSRDLGTLDFFIERGFHDSAVALLDALDQRHPGAPELAGYRSRVTQMRRDP